MKSAMDALTLFGLFAVTAMLVSYASPTHTCLLIPAKGGVNMQNLTKGARNQ